MANPFMRATISIKDRASRTLDNITQSHNRLNAAMQTGKRISSQVNQQSRATAQAVQSNVKAVRSHNSAVKEENKQMRRRSITWLGMLKVMGLFALNLQIIRAATSPFTFLRGAIDVAKDFEFGLSQINALLRVSKPEILDFGLSLRRLGGELGIATADLLTAAKQIASSIDSLNIGKFSEAQAVLEVLRQSARGAVVDNSNLKDAVVAVQVVLASLRIPIERTEAVMKSLFAVVDVGDTSFSELGNEIGTFAAELSTVLPKELVQQTRFLNETFAAFAALTQIMPTSEAATSIKRFFVNFIKQSKGQKEAIAAIQKETGVDLSLENLIRSGPVEFFENITTAIGADSPIIKGLRADIAAGRELTEADLAAFQQSTSAKLAALISPNVRALKPTLLLSQPGFLKQVFAGLIVSIEAFNEAQDIALGSFAVSLKRLSSIWDALKISLATPLIKEAVKPIKAIADALNNVVNAVGFDQLSTQDKISRTLDTIVFQLNRWWDTGGSKKIDNFTNIFVDGIIIFLQKAIFDNTDKFIKIGESIAKGIFIGMIEAAKDPQILAKLAPIIALRAAGLGFGRAIPAGLLINAGIEEGTDTGGLGVGSTLRTLGLFAGAGAIGKGLGGVISGGLRGLGNAGVSAGGPATRSTAGAAIGGAVRTFGPTAAILGGGGVGRGAAAGVRALGLRGGLAVGGVALTGLLAAEIIPRFFGFNGAADFVNSGIFGGGTEDARAEGQAIAAAAGAGGLGNAFAALDVSQTRLAELNQASSFKSFLNPFGAKPEGTRGFLGIPSGALLNDAQARARGSIEGIERTVFASLGLPYDVFKGQLTPLLSIARNAGLTTPSEQATFLSAVAAIAQAENAAFDPNSNVLDPTSFDSKARSIGLLQLNTRGLGQGRSISDLQDVGTNLDIGGRSIAAAVNRLIKQGQTPNSSDFFQNVAIGSGFPTSIGSIANLTDVQRLHVARVQAQGFANFQTLGNNPFAAIDAGGTTGNQGGLSVTVAGDFIVKLDDVEILNALTEAIADELAARGLAPTDLQLAAAE